MAILLMSIAAILLMAIGCYFINDYLLLFYYWLSVAIPLMTIGDYVINGYW